MIDTNDELAMVAGQVFMLRRLALLPLASLLLSSAGEV
jgi:hypothetical protein